MSWIWVPESEKWILNSCSQKYFPELTFHDLPLAWTGINICQGYWSNPLETNSLRFIPYFQNYSLPLLNIVQSCIICVKRIERNISSKHQFLPLEEWINKRDLYKISLNTILSQVYDATMYSHQVNYSFLKHKKEKKHLNNSLCHRW